MGDINKEKLPGPEFLQQKSGTKKGQVVMIREANGNVTAHQWSTAAQEWVSVGTVVDAVGSGGRKQEYLGRDYDYVFDVDIQEGLPALKLPYNLAQNPYEAATTFLQDNELPMTYLDQVAAFITSNTQGATIGQSQGSEAAGPDPFGIESRYRPGDDTASADRPSVPTATTVSPSQVLPQRTYLSIKQGNVDIIQAKIEEFNHNLISTGHKDISLNKTDIDTLREVTTALSHSPPQLIATSAAIRHALDLVMGMVVDWPPAQRLPALDLLRLLASASSEVATGTYAPDESNVVAVLARSSTFEDRERSNNIMLGVRTFANLFETSAGLVYRALVAAGTLLIQPQDDEVREAARSVYGLPDKIATVKRKTVEPRVRNVVAEMEKVL
ncbi:MAG: hypothetical protein M1826_005215 [Phylliscum demangeonii]|nr:MAG: hypothetical protein M1826_005215 [Phylliscum demangeonii]